MAIIHGVVPGIRTPSPHSSRSPRVHRRAARRAAEALRSPGLRTPTLRSRQRPAIRSGRPADRGLMTEDDREFASTLPARAWAPGWRHGRPAPIVGDAHDRPGRRGRRRSLRSIAGKLSTATESARCTADPSRSGGVASPRGSSSSVRAAGLYPAGSRFESWLPYQPIVLPRWLSPRRSRTVLEDPLSAASRQAALRRQRGDPRRELVGRRGRRSSVVRGDRGLGARRRRHRP